MNKIQTVNGHVFEDKKQLFFEIEYHLLTDQSPSNYLNDISSRKIFHEYPFSMLINLKDTIQSPTHHPEGHAWNHTMLVVDEAAKLKDKSKEQRIFMWAALLHDIGKPDTTKSYKGKITSYNHDKEGATLAAEFLNFFNCDENFVQKVAALVLYHMHILYVLKNLPYGNVYEMKKQTDIHELALLGLCDRLGRLDANRKEEEENIEIFLSKVARDLQ